MSFVIEKRISAFGAITVEDNLVLANYFDKRYLANFANPGAGNSITIRKYASTSADLYEGTITFDTLEEDFKTLTINKRIYKAIELSDDEIGLDVADFNMQVMDPLFRAMVQKIEDECFSEFYKVQHTAKYFEGYPEKLEDITMLEAQSEELNFPGTMMKLDVVDPVTAGRIKSANTNQLSDASFVGDAGAALQRSEAGTISGVNLLKSNKVPKKVLSALDQGSTPTATAQIPVSKDVTTISISGLTSGDTLAKGDVLVFNNAGEEIRVNVETAYTAIGTADVVSVFSVPAVIPAATPLTVENVGFGCLITPVTFAIASYRQKAIDRSNTDYVEDPNSGVSIRIRMGGEINDFQHKIILDAKMGTQYVNEFAIRHDLATDPVAP